MSPSYTPRIVVRRPSNALLQRFLSDLDKRVRLELEQKLPRELAKLSLEVANLRQEAFQASPEEMERLKGDFIGTIRDNAARWQGPEKPRS